MSVQLKLDAQLRELVERTRARMADTGGLRPPIVEPYQSPFSEEARQAILELVGSGDYRRLADVVADDDPEIADL